MIYPNNLLEVLDNDKFHHTEKGCDMELKPHKANDGNWSQEYYCHTHSVLCSKTGWELGWYQGTNSNEIYALGDRECEMCGTYTEPKKHYCKDCLKKIYLKRLERLKIKNRELARLREKKRVAERVAKKKEKEKDGNYYDKIGGKKLDDVLGFINEYQKADYHDRIRCHQYNELVEKADMLISRTIKRRLNKNI